jgi:hypothetical protein
MGIFCAAARFTNHSFSSTKQNTPDTITYERPSSTIAKQLDVPVPRCAKTRNSVP